MELLITELEKPTNAFEGKDLLMSKLLWSKSFNDAYLEEKEKEEINRIFKAKKQIFRLR